MKVSAGSETVWPGSRLKATIRRSARRQTVRHRWRCAAAGWPPGKHEGAQGFERGIEFVDLGFEPRRLGGNDAQGLVAQVLAGIGHAKIGAQIEEVVLDAGQHGIELGEIRRAGVKPGDADRRIGLVHRAIGLDAQVVLGDALARAQGRVALVAGARVDAIENDHGKAPCQPTPSPGEEPGRDLCVRGLQDHCD